MKKIINLTVLVILITSSLHSNAQSRSRPATIEDLKAYIGLTSKKVDTQLAKNGYTSYFTNDDKANAPFIFKHFKSDEEWEEMSIILSENKVIGVSHAFTKSDHSHFLRSFEIFDWVKIVDQKMIVNVGRERVDLWISDDKKWKVKIDYLKGGSGLKDEITNVTLTTNQIKYSFE